MVASKVLSRLMLATTVALCLAFVCQAQEQAGAAGTGATADSDAAGVQGTVKAETAVAISMDDLKRLLDRKETPRVQLVTKFSTLTGRAVRIEKGSVFVDVGEERVAVAGVLGLPASQIREIKVLAALSEEERKALQAASEAYLEKVRSQAVQAETPPPATEEAAGDQEGEAGATEATGEPSGAEKGGPAEKKERDLLAIYPPEQGWGPQKVAEITRKRIVLGLQPVDKDESFLRDYDAWCAAYSTKRNQQLEMQAAYQASGQVVPETFVVLPELEPVPSLEGEPWTTNEGQ